MKMILTFVVVALMSATSIAQESQGHNASLSEKEQLLVAAQKICPVTGQELGSMGDPIPAKFGEQTVFLCCQGCQGKDADPQHWKTIQSNLAMAQGTCPIMGKPVTGDSQSTIVDGHPIFVCCPPCIAKVQADADAVLVKVTASYVSFVAKERQVNSDRLHARAQAICPVTGQKLGSMGEPIKVKVGEKGVAFLCCQQCVDKQIKAEHWKTVLTNLAKAQKSCPVMGQAVDASMKWTVVNGRRIFVCCPPCIEKIEADPETYIAKLDAQIAANENLDRAAE